MDTSISRGQQAALLACVLATVASRAEAQGLMSTAGTIVAATGDAVPDLTGTPIPNTTFGNTLDDCFLDDSGKVIFRSLLIDSMIPVTALNDRAMMYGSTRADLKMVARGNDLAPGAGLTLPANSMLRTIAGTSTGLASAGVRASPDGRLWWGSFISDGGVLVTAANDSCLFAGPFGSQALLLREGDVAPGTGGATFSEAFNAASTSFFGMNSNGKVFMRAVMATGSGVPAVVTTAGVNNSQGLWAGDPLIPGDLTLIARKSNPVQGLGGEVAIDNSNSLSFHMESNASNHVLFDITLSTTQGAPAATAATDRLLMVYTPGSGNQVLVRESDPAPGTGGGTFNSISLTDNWGATLAANAWLRNDTVIFGTELRGGNTVAGISDTAIYRGGVGSLTMVARRGDTAPGTGGATWNGFNNRLHNVRGQVAFQGFLNIVAPVTSANDTGIWTGLPGSLQLIAREGQVMPGTGGGTAGSMNGAAVYFNDAGQVLFNTTLSGGTSPGTSLWLWDQAAGLRAIILVGDTVTLPAGVKVVSGYSALEVSNTDGAGQAFSHNGTIAARVDFTGGARAIMILKLPNTISTAFCSGDGTDAACPCSNVGLAGRGCENTSSTGGASLSTSGLASVSADTLKLTSSNAVPFGPGLYYEGDMKANPSAPFGVPFGNGLRCAGGATNRLEIAFADAAGMASTTVALGAFGAAVAGTTYHYQLWYRDGAVGGTLGTCVGTAAGFNFSNARSLTWVP